jgi:signal peptide peptidase SppA
MSTHRNGNAILQAFVSGVSLLAPQFIPSLREFATEQNEGVLANMLRPLASLMGRGDAPADRLADNLSKNDQVMRSYGMESSDRGKPFAFADGIAIIPLHGALLHRDNDSYGGATGYDYIASRYRAALADPDVKGIMFDINSGGGHVAGNFELCDEIVAGRAVKPSLAVVDSAGYSGAYSLATAANRIVAAPSAGVGSIGVVAMHMSVQGFLEKNGINISLIHAGEHKVDSYPFKDLPEGARARMQASVDKSYEKFVSLVATNRGIDAKAVRDTEALCYDAEDALGLGLIDAIQTREVAFGAFRSELSGSTTNPHKGAMSMANDTAATGGAAPATDTNVATPVVAPAAAAPADPVATERERVKSITTCEEAKGREAMAQHLAFNTSMSVEDAKKLLVIAPVAAAAAAAAAAPAAAGASPFAAAMEGTVNPNVGSGVAAGVSGEQAEVPKGERMARAWADTTGNKLRGDK